MITQLYHTHRHSASTFFEYLLISSDQDSVKMITTFITYVCMPDLLRRIFELTDFADRDYETRTYTYVSCFSQEWRILTLSAASAVFSSMAGQSEEFR